MKIEIINGIRVVTPESEMWLCNETDRVISDKVYLGVNADETMWKDITEEGKTRLEELWNSEDFQQATEQDYQNALSEMGVNLNV